MAGQTTEQRLAWIKLQEVKEVAAARLKRYKCLQKLWEEGAYPQGDLDAAELDLKTAQFELEAAQIVWEEANKR